MSGERVISTVCRAFAFLAFECPENVSGLVVEHCSCHVGCLIGLLLLVQELHEALDALRRLGGIAVAHCLCRLPHTRCQLLPDRARCI